MDHDRQLQGGGYQPTTSELTPFSWTAQLRVFLTIRIPPLRPPRRRRVPEFCRKPEGVAGIHAATDSSRADCGSEAGRTVRQVEYRCAGFSCQLVKAAHKDSMIRQPGEGPPRR
jgi:hypothetical protein